MPPKPSDATIVGWRGYLFRGASSVVPVAKPKTAADRPRRTYQTLVGRDVENAVIAQDPPIERLDLGVDAPAPNLSPSAIPRAVVQRSTNRTVVAKPPAPSFELTPSIAAPAVQTAASRTVSDVRRPTAANRGGSRSLSERAGSLFEPEPSTTNDAKTEAAPAPTPISNDDDSWVPLREESSTPRPTPRVDGRAQPQGVTRRPVGRPGMVRHAADFQPAELAPPDFPSVDLPPVDLPLDPPVKPRLFPVDAPDENRAPPAAPPTVTPAPRPRVPRGPELVPIESAPEVSEPPAKRPAVTAPQLNFEPIEPMEPVPPKVVAPNPAPPAERKFRFTPPPRDPAPSPAPAPAPAPELTPFDEPPPPKVPAAPPGAEQPATDGDDESADKPKLSFDSSSGAANERDLLLRSARAAFAAGNLEDAVQRFERLLQRFPDDKLARIEYSGVLVQLGRYQEAVKQYEALVKADPKNAGLRTALADTYVQLKDYAKAVEQLQIVLKAEPANLEAAAKLARAYAFRGELNNGLEVYRRYLLPIPAANAKGPKLIPPVLLDLQLPQEALDYLLDAEKRFPNDVFIAENMARAYGALRNHEKAVEYALRLQRPEQQEVEGRLETGNSLHESESFDAARAIFHQILETAPNNRRAKIGLARIAVALYEVGNAKAILAELKSKNSNDIPFLMVVARYHVRISEYAEAKLVLWEILRRDENDHDARLLLSTVYSFQGEAIKCAGEAAKVPRGVIVNRYARLSLADALASQRKFDDANTILRSLLNDDEVNGAAVRQLTRNLSKTGQAAAAEAFCRQTLNNEIRDPRQRVEITIALGDALFYADKVRESVEVFDGLIRTAIGRTPAAYYGLARGHRKLGNVHALAGGLDPIAADMPAGLPMLLGLSDLYDRDRDNQGVLEMTVAAIPLDPENPATLVRQADAIQGIDKFKACLGKKKLKESMQPAVAAYEHALTTSPTNTRMLIGLARTLSTARCYDESLAVYDRLLKVDPDLPSARRERARVFNAMNHFLSSAGAFAGVQDPSADVQLRL
ncbi:MAG: tetratricopeptide repeat protein, partial [Planctomycetia bacterium]